MGTILKHNYSSKSRFRDSIACRILILCCSVSLFLVLLTSTIILRSIESAAYSAKKSELSAAASEYSTSLSVYGLNSQLILPKNVSEINRRILVTDSSLRVVFDSSATASHKGKTAYLPPVLAALQGDKYFEFDFSPFSLESVISMPITKDGKTIGTVCIFETDLSLQHIYKALFGALFAVCLLIILFIFATWLFISFFFEKRIFALYDTVKKAQDDENIEQIPIEYNDEMSHIIREVNNIYARLSYVQQMRQAFVSDASHELRTPLAAIRLLCESITQSDNIDVETVREFMDDIVLEVDRMSHTAEKLLVLSKLDSGSKAPLAPVSVSEIVHKMITAFDPIAKDKNITIKSYLEDNCSILGDMEGANQIIGNLIDNAIKYNNEGGILRIYLFSKNGQCTFITDDTGIGIAPEYREHVFERFFRVDKARERDGRGGSGLGLAIVKRNVEAFGGTIRISDSVTGGARFTVVFPSLTTDEEVQNI